MSETKQEYREGIYESVRRRAVKELSTKALLDLAVNYDLITRDFLIDLIHESTISFEEIINWE